MIEDSSVASVRSTCSRHRSTGPMTFAWRTAGSSAASPRYMSSVPARLRNTVLRQRLRSAVSVSASAPPVVASLLITDVAAPSCCGSPVILPAPTLPIAPPFAASTGRVTAVSPVRI